MLAKRISNPLGNNYLWLSSFVIIRTYYQCRRSPKILWIEVPSWFLLTSTQVLLVLYSWLFAPAPLFCFFRPNYYIFVTLYVWTVMSSQFCYKKFRCPLFCSVLCARVIWTTTTWSFSCSLHISLEILIVVSMLQSVWSSIFFTDIPLRRFSVTSCVSPLVATEMHPTLHNNPSSNPHRFLELSSLILEFSLFAPVPSAISRLSSFCKWSCEVFRAPFPDPVHSVQSRFSRAGLFPVF